MVKISREHQWGNRLWALGLSTAVAFAADGAKANPSALQRSTAEILFQQGVELVGSGQYATACQKFEGSLELDVAVGTMLRLADCYDRIGKTASAWGLFEQVMAISEASGDVKRNRIAEARANDVKERLSRIRLDVPKELAALKVEIVVGGAEIPRATWTTPFPIDPGVVAIVARAPGYTPWQGEIMILEGPSLQHVSVPKLARRPEPKLIDGPAPRGALQERDTAESRVWPYVLAGAGLAGLGVGAYLTLRARDLDRQSRTSCRAEDARLCTSEGVALRREAIDLANGATVSALGGLLALGAGAAWLLWSSGDERGADAEALRFVAQPSVAGCGLRLEGQW